jgi:hypothetical protein
MTDLFQALHKEVGGGVAKEDEMEEDAQRKAPLRTRAGLGVKERRRAERGRRVSLGR